MVDASLKTSLPHGAIFPYHAQNNAKRNKSIGKRSVKVLGFSPCQSASQERLRLVGCETGGHRTRGAGGRWLDLLFGDEGGGMSGSGCRWYLLAWEGSVSVRRSSWLEGLLWDGDHGCGADDDDSVAGDSTLGSAGWG